MSAKIYYGMHFYPGVAQYDSAKGSHRIYLNENTLRKMDKTFSGKPVFVEHVDKVQSDRNELRKEADGWVVESFYNEIDGKHWTKFITVTDNADRAIARGYKLSNAYNPDLNGRPGVWNGVPYDDEPDNGEYEHLAIVEKPRYNESIIMTPEEFKRYNENLKQELLRISNSTKQENKMSIKDTIKGMFYTKKTIENSVDIGETFVTLPKSGKEFSIMQIINAMDEAEENKKINEASPDMKVKLHDGTICNVLQLLEKYENACKKNEKMSTTTGLDMKPESIDVEGDLHNEDDSDDDEDDEEKKKMKMKKENKKKNEDDDDDEEKKKKKMENSLKRKENFESLKNAPFNAIQNDAIYDSNDDKIARGKARYGS